jgi:transcriptional regulator with XRE-family HTH domain
LKCLFGVVRLFTYFVKYKFEMNQGSTIQKIGEKIKKLRIENNLGQADLAYMSGISKSVISKIENGRSVPSLPMLLNLLQHLNVELSYFFGDILINSPQKALLIKSEDVKPYTREQSIGFDYRFIYGGYIQSEYIEMNLLHLDVRSYRNEVRSDAFQIDYLVSGHIKNKVDDSFYEMKTGDTLIYNGDLPHVAENLGTETAIILGIYLYDKVPDRKNKPL